MESLISGMPKPKVISRYAQGKTEHRLTLRDGVMYLEVVRNHRVEYIQALGEIMQNLIMNCMDSGDLVNTYETLFIFGNNI